MPNIKNDYVTHCLSLEKFIRREFDLPYPMPLGDSAWRAGNIEQESFAEACIDCLNHMDKSHAASDLISDLEKCRGKSIKEIDDLDWLFRRFNSFAGENVFKVD